MSSANNYCDRSCPICKDNFIVNNKFIKCELCSSQSHVQCLRIKDPVVKTLSESRNLRFYCDTCILVVDSKLSGPSQKVDNQALIADLENLISRATESMLQKMATEISELRTEVRVLKESNIDLVRLLTSDEKHKTLEEEDVVLVEHIERDMPPLEPKKKVPEVNSLSKNRVKTTSGKLDKGSDQKSTRPAEKSNANSKIKHLTGTNHNKNPEHHNKRSVLTKKGTSQPSSLIQPAPKGRNWIWVGGLNVTTTAENIIAYANEIWPEKDILCFDLKSKRAKKSFKLGSRDLDLAVLLAAEHWPEGTLIRPFRMERRANVP